MNFTSILMPIFVVLSSHFENEPSGYLSSPFEEENYFEETFEIKVNRKNEIDSENLLEGELTVDGDNLGKTYERKDLRISPGTYPGFLRYISKRGHAQGPFGEMGDEGDFLLEIGKVKWSDGKERDNLLFHGGNKAKQSEGCIMLGAVQIDRSGNRTLPSDHPLRKLRLKFYGTDTPNSTPNKRILITITE